MQEANIRRIDADVVVVGGGAAGTFAALTLAKRGFRVVIVCKGLVGKSGASIFAGNLALAGHLLGNSEANAKNSAEHLIKYHNQFLIDQEWARRCAKWIEDVYYPELESSGLYFRRDADGQIATSPGAVRSVAANVQGNSGVTFMDLRRKQVIRAGIERVEETAVTSLLLTRDGTVGGVFALDIMRGEFVAIHARATVLATGYSDRLHTRSTGTREMSADGIAMAWRAGAAMMNLEMQWWHTNDVAFPECWQRMQVYPNPIVGSPHSARMTNRKGEEFFNQQIDSPIAFGPYTVQLKALVKQVQAGNARYGGDYFAGFDHIPRDELDRYTSYAKLFDQLGLDVTKDLVETAVTAHYRQGGLLVNPNDLRASVPGLYAAGGVGGHSNGFMALATFDGQTVAETIEKDYGGLPDIALAGDATANEAARLDALRVAGAEGPLAPLRLKAELQALMWECAGIEKSESSLTEGLRRLDDFVADRLPRMRIRSSGRVANYEWLAANEVHNMAVASELILRASLQRTESRGPFMRLDYPDTDNVDWLAANVMHRTDDGVKFERVRYATPYVVPSFARKPNLEVAW